MSHRGHQNASKRWRRNAKFKRGLAMLRRCSASPSKTVFHTLEGAEVAARDITQRVKGQTFRPYLCSTCGRYHLTSRPKRLTTSGDRS